MVLYFILIGVFWMKRKKVEIMRYGSNGNSFVVIKNIDEYVF